MMWTYIFLFMFTILNFSICYMQYKNRKTFESMLESFMDLRRIDLLNRQKLTIRVGLLEKLVKELGEKIFHE